MALGEIFLFDILNFVPKPTKYSLPVAYKTNMISLLTGVWVSCFAYLDLARFSSFAMGFIL